MIRDPSDGTVREVPKVEVGIPATRPTNGIIPAMPGPDTGIRQPTRTDAQQRLEKWRKWLKDYHAKKETAHAGGNDRGTDTAPEAGLRDDRRGAE